MLCDANGLSLRFAVAGPGKRHLECSGTLGLGSHPRQARPISQALPLVVGRQRLRGRALASVLRPLPDATCDFATSYETQAQAGTTKAVRPPESRQRNIIERMFGLLKESRRIGTRYDKLARSFAAMTTLATHAAVPPTAVLFVQNLG